MTVSDNSLNVIVPGALSYIQTKTEREGQYWQAAFGSFYMPGLSFGLSLNYLDQDLVGVESYDQLNGSAGILYLRKGTFERGETKWLDQRNKLKRFVNARQAPKAKSAKLNCAPKVRPRLQKSFSEITDSLNVIEVLSWPQTWGQLHDTIETWRIRAHKNSESSSRLYHNQRFQT